MSRLRKIACLLLLACVRCQAQQAAALLQAGWQSLLQDDDTTALRAFSNAYIAAQRAGDIAGKAKALLYLGICSYGVSPAEGWQYAQRSMQEYARLEQANPLLALEGRSRCLQLISTIQSRQGRYREAVALSREAIKGFPPGGDTTGSLGLIYYSLGSNYTLLGQPDSAARCYRLALAEHLRTSNTAYLPAALIKVAALEQAQRHKEQSLSLYRQALKLADSTGNRQAQVLALLGMGDWQMAFAQDATATLGYYLQAEQVAATLRDKSFPLRAAERLLGFYKQTGDYGKALNYKDTISGLRDSMYSWDRRKAVKSLEIQYEVAEKDRQLGMARKEQALARLTNYLLWGGLAALLAISTVIILLLLRNGRRDKALLQAKEALVQAAETQRQLIEEQKKLQALQMRQEIEHKESQLSAMTLQMIQKNELMQELKARVAEDKAMESDQKLNKIINKGLAQDQEWSDFNTCFERINQHFYTRLKAAYPAISPADLKICALTKLHLSIKEMAAILNISPDSVKTARYRLRKKLGLNTEDNLTEFIMTL